MPKRFALGIVIVIAVLGALFLGLDIFDIEENFRLHLPTAVLNTVFISVIAVTVTCVAARGYTISGLPQMVWLGCGALAFGVGTLLREWLVGEGLDVPITLYDGIALIASILHLLGAGFSMVKSRLPQVEAGRRLGIVLFCYLGVLVIVALVTILVFQGVISPFYVFGEEAPLIRDIVRGMTGIFFLAAAAIYLGIYSKLRTAFLFYYSLGLILFAFGIIFMSLGAVESRIVWLGRASHYIGGIYFLVTVLGTQRLTSGGKGRLTQSGDGLDSARDVP
jgi:hypothetical protein